MGSVVSVKELFRKGIFEINKPRILTREWACVLSDDVLFSPITDTQLAAALGTNIGTVHPEYSGYYCRKLTVTEGHGDSPYHVHVLGEYGVVLANELVSPTSRVNVWEFESSAGQVPALYYYSGDGNGSRQPLTNSAGDYFPGLVAEEGLVVASVTKNFSSLPTSWIGAQNFVNDDVYLGCPAHSWKVGQVKVSQSQEDFAGTLVKFWQATAQLQYRQSGHNLQLPDIGYNSINNGVKQRCMVFDFQNAEWVPSPNPLGLDGNGGQVNGSPAILNRRISPVADFDSLFGAPPTVPLA